MPELVPIQRLIPHPDNPNRLAPDLFAKLKRHISETGQYPALIVRSLGKSTRFTGQALQIIDGHHRHKILHELHHTQVMVENWGDLDDTQTARLLATLNRLRGRDDPAKRASLLSLLRESMDTELLSQYVPESAEQIIQKIEKIKVQEVSIDEAAADFEPLTILVDEHLGRIIRAAIRLRRSKGNLPGQNLDPLAFMTIHSGYEQARALAQNPGHYRHGYRLSNLYNVNVRMDKLMDKYRMGLHDPGRMAEFVNDQLGLAWSMEGSSVTEKMLEQASRGDAAGVPPYRLVPSSQLEWRKLEPAR